MRRHRILGIRVFLGVVVIFGVCERTFPAFDSDPCVGIFCSSVLCIFVLVGVLLSVFLFVLDVFVLLFAYLALIDPP